MPFDEDRMRSENEEIKLTTDKSVDRDEDIQVWRESAEGEGEHGERSPNHGHQTTPQGVDQTTNHRS